MIPRGSSDMTNQKYSLVIFKKKQIYLLKKKFIDMLFSNANIFIGYIFGKM